MADHWLTWDVDSVVGCHCGFRADTDADGGYGDSVVKHLLAVGWDEGYGAGCDHAPYDRYSESDPPSLPNPYREEG